MSFVLVHSASHADESIDRSFVTDHPGPIDNPRTQYEGLFRVEANALSLGTDKDEENTTRTQNYGSFFLTRGMTSRSELQVGVDGYKVIQNGGIAQRGVGSSIVRYKYNLYGNDSGNFAIAAIPKIVYTGSLDGNLLTGGMNVPMLFTLPQNWYLAIMPIWDYARSSDGSGESLYTVPVVVSYDVISSLTLFGQFTSAADGEKNFTFQEGIGFAYRPLPKLQFDVQFDYGKNNSIESTKMFLGVSYGIR
jgi:hypothetical protein